MNVAQMLKLPWIRATMQTTLSDLLDLAYVQFPDMQVRLILPNARRTYASQFSSSVCCASNTEAIADALADDKTHLGLGSLLVDLGLLLSHHGLVLIQGHFLQADKDEHARSTTLQELLQQDI